MTSRASIWLIRHAAHAGPADVLIGRNQEIGLSAAGRAQARALACRLEPPPLRIVSSPSRRALETASLLAGRLQLPVATSDDLNEIDFGDWAGRTFGELANERAWQVWNAERGTARTPAGDTMKAALERALSCIGQLAEADPGPLALFTHAEIIRAVLLYCSGRQLSAWSEIEVPLACSFHLTCERDAAGATILRQSARARPRVAFAATGAPP